MYRRTRSGRQGVFDLILKRETTQRTKFRFWSGRWSRITVEFGLSGGAHSRLGLISEAESGLFEGVGRLEVRIRGIST